MPCPSLSLARKTDIPIMCWEYILKAHRKKPMKKTKDNAKQKIARHDAYLENSATKG
jgi:bifunctional DNase/RNase